MFKNKKEKVAFAITMIVVTVFTVWFSWLRPEKYEATFETYAVSQIDVYGANGTYCDESQCYVAIYDGIPGEGEIVLYFQADIDQMGDEDVDEYFYLVDYTREEMDEFGYDVFEGSNEDILYQYFGKYVAGYYYY